MKHAVLLSALLCSMAAWAAGPKAKLVDHSNPALIDEAAAKQVMEENIPAKVWKVYPVSKWTFASQVVGGVNAAGTCVVSARVMLLPLTPTMKAVLFRPEKTATAFDAKAGTGIDQCKDLAREKLKEATLAVVSDLVKS
jgi:hypothetical protein